MASQAAKPRARRASRAPLGKSMSVDESVLSAAGQTTTSSSSGQFGRPTSMLARTASSSGAVLNPTHANAHTTTTARAKSGSISQSAIPQSKLVADQNNGKLAAAGAQRRVLGDLSNANKLAGNIGGKDAAAKDTKPARIRSSTASSLNGSKPLAPKSSAAVSNSTTSHSRSTSAASRHSVISQKSSHSSLHAAAPEHRRTRTHSDNASIVAGPAPGAPRIGTGNWTASSNNAKVEDEEILDTVVEGDSYSAGDLPQQGLGIAFEEKKAIKQDVTMGGAAAAQDELMDTSGPDSLGDSSNESFELDLDPVLQEDNKPGMQLDRPATIPEYEDEYDAQSRKVQDVRSPKAQVQFNNKKIKTEHPTALTRDPNDWLSLTNSAQKEADRQVNEILEVFEDKPDAMDTSMVAEYSEEIFAYMEELEIDSMANPNYMDSQTEIEWPMRATLIDWLLQVHMRYHMLPETLWITINIVDRFLSNRVVSLVKLQLVGITAMFVAAKYEEIMAPSVDEFVYMTENNYSREEILKGERIILASLDFKISNYCSPYSWMRRISKADEYDVQTRTLSKFLMEVTLLDHRFLRCKPSTISAVGMYLARRMLGGDWNDAFVFYSRHTEAQLAQPTSLVLSAIAADDFEDKFVYQKYSVKKHLKASIFARQWAKATLESATRAHELSMK